MCPGIVWITELVQYCALPLGLHFQSQIARTLHPLFLGHFQQLRAVSRHRLFALHAHMRRHNQNQAVTTYSGGHGQRDAGIATGRLDKRVAGSDITALLSLGDHTQGGTILDRACGVIALQFSQNGIAGIPRQALQAYQGRVANACFDSRVFRHDDTAGERVSDYIELAQYEAMWNSLFAHSAQPGR